MEAVVPKINVLERQNLYTKIVSMHSTFRNLGNHELSYVLQRQADINVVGKIKHKSFNIRNTKRYKSCIPS